jgi:hypothetical protein
MIAYESAEVEEMLAPAARSGRHRGTAH